MATLEFSQGNLKDVNQIIFLYPPFSTIKCYTLLIHLVVTFVRFVVEMCFFLYFFYFFYLWNLEAYVNERIPILKVAPFRLYTLNSINCKKLKSQISV